MKYPENLLSFLPCTVFFLDSSFTITGHNDVNINLFGIEKGLPLFECIPFALSENKFALEKCAVSHFNNASEVFTRSFIYQHKEGREQMALIILKKCDRLTAYTYIGVLCDMTDEKECLMRQTGMLLNVQDNFTSRIVGQNEKMLEINKLIRFAADSNATVLISGESGTGKELIADAIHYNSSRKNKPYIKINCSALSETLLESELFGHVKGSFTGAYKDKKGKFEEAQGGTIFLDEISEITPTLQVKLLRVIQEKTIERVGDNKVIKVDMRIIAATNKNLRELTQKNAFREDLFYRLNVFNIKTVPLRDRKNDIPLLCQHFINKFNKDTGKKIKGITSDAFRLLMDYCWPGNVRELENVIEHAFVVVEKSIIDIFDFPQELRQIAYRDGICKNKASVLPAPVTETPTQEKFKGKNGHLRIDKTSLLKILEANNWNQSKTAKELGVSRVGLWKKIKKLGIKLF
ncbi:MAG: Transcriptional regulatory protein ZraR [Bacteroidetes bacterium ADurb.Bin408]|nr:MAG: Transcriptional regulatory protein ZraR [Bacteroidetes bacterium ADurb.Bin408]